MMQHLVLNSFIMIRLKYFFLPALYLIIGSFITFTLLKAIVNYNSVGYLVLLIPMSMLTVLLTVIGIVNTWIQYRMWKEKIVMHIYGGKEILWLYFRSWLVLICGITLAVVFYWLSELLPTTIQDLIKSLNMLFYIICAFLTLMGIISIIRTEDLNEIRIRNFENENQLLKAQLNPHFLYNTLNNIDALVWIDQERASNAIVTLSELMRFFTYSSKQNYISIQEDVDHIEQLINLQKLRMQRDNSLIFNYSIDHTEQLIAPLLMLPLVENCFKHCGNLDEENAIKIDITLNNNVLTFMTDNNLPDNIENKQKKGGVGLNVLRRRLSLLYPKRYSLLTECKDRRYHTTLTIEL